LFYHNACILIHKSKSTQEANHLQETVQYKRNQTFFFSQIIRKIF